MVRSWGGAVETIGRGGRQAGDAVSSSCVPRSRVLHSRVLLSGVLRGNLVAGLGLAGAVLFASAPAVALLAPQYYEQARREAASVILMSVEKSVPPAEGYGACRVTGTVRAVERGAAYVPGQSVTLDVPCVAPGAQPPLGGTLYQPVARLAAAPFGRAYLDAAGAVVLSQYEPLDALP